MKVRVTALDHVEASGDSGLTVEASALPQSQRGDSGKQIISLGLPPSTLRSRMNQPVAYEVAMYTGADVLRIFAKTSRFGQPSGTAPARIPLERHDVFCPALAIRDSFVGSNGLAEGNRFQ